jgi:hypothetical protein
MGGAAWGQVEPIQSELEQSIENWRMEIEEKV